HYPGGPDRCCLVMEMARSRAGLFPIRSAFPDLAAGRHVGVRKRIHIAAFEACSSFTRVTACQIARPPIVGFVTRFRSARLPGLTARQLSNLTINYSSGSFPHW